MSVTACIYTRLSKAPDGSTEKVERQEEDARQVADRLGWKVGHVYVDNSKSAWRRDVIRKGWEQMLGDLEAGRWDAVVVYHGDRLVRQPRDLERLLSIADERRLRLASVTGDRDLSSADDRFVLRIEAAQACRESDNISRRTSRAKQAAAKKGLPAQGRRRAYGWTADGTELVPHEAAELRSIAERVLLGESMVGIMRDLKDRAVPTVDGGVWRVTTLRDMLSNPRIAGLATYKGEIVGRCHRPAILDEDTWRMLRGIFTLRAGGRHAPREGRYLLSGIARCGTCTGPLYVNRDHGRPLYLCRNDGCTYHVGRDQRQLDEFLTGVVVGMLGTLELHPPTGTGADRLHADLAGLEARRRHLEDELLSTNGRSAALITKAVFQLDERIDALRARIAGMIHQPAAHVRGISRKQWDALPLDRRRAVIRGLVTVVVLPTRTRGGRGGFDPSFVQIQPV